MHRQSTKRLGVRRAVKITVVLTIILATVATFPSLPRTVDAQTPTPFLASPYYGPPGDGVSQRWIAGSHNGIDFLIYGHLSAARATGAVSKGQWIGTSGDTGQSSGPHLHFEVRHGEGTPVNPDNESGVSLWTDGEWTGSNPAASVPTRRFATLNAYGTATTVDDTPDNTGGFTKGMGWSGNSITCPPSTCSAWTRVTTTGNAGDMYYTGVWGNTPDYWARWQPNLPQTGLYEVQVYFPCYGTIDQRTWFARYRIHSQSGALDVRVDQVGVEQAGVGMRGCNEWLSLGHYAFASGTAGSVYVFDDTGEQYSTGRKVLADAVRFRPVTVGPFEAEEYTQGPGLRERIARSSHNWEQYSSLAGYSGSGYMEALPNSGMSINTGYAATSPELRYRVVFPAAGTYHVWLRGYGGSGHDDSIHAGYDNLEIPTADRICGCGWNVAGWSWCKNTMDDGASPATFYIASPGPRTFNLWMREDGFRVDRALLTQDASYAP
jgi:hypothetical protein